MKGWHFIIMTRKCIMSYFFMQTTRRSYLKEKSFWGRMRKPALDARRIPQVELSENEVDENVRDSRSDMLPTGGNAKNLLDAESHCSTAARMTKSRKRSRISVPTARAEFELLSRWWVAAQRLLFFVRPRWNKHYSAWWCLSIDEFSFHIMAWSCHRYNP